MTVLTHSWTPVRDVRGDGLGAFEASTSGPLFEGRREGPAQFVHATGNMVTVPPSILRIRAKELIK